MSLLFRRSSRSRLGRWRSRFAGRGRCRSYGLVGRATRSGRRHAGLSVEGFHDRLRDVDGRPVPDHRTARPLLGGIEDHAIAAVAGVLHDEWSHAGEDFISDLALLALEIFLRVLGGAIETLLLASICFTSLSRDSSFSLSCWALSCFLRLSISSAKPFSSFCLGSNFLLSASKSRRPSLEAKIACSMLMVPTLVPVALAAAAAAAEGESGGWRPRERRQPGWFGPEPRGKGRTIQQR